MLERGWARGRAAWETGCGRAGKARAGIELIIKSQGAGLKAFLSSWGRDRRAGGWESGHALKKKERFGGKGGTWQRDSRAGRGERVARGS